MQLFLYYEDEIDPNEIFSAFFGGAFGGPMGGTTFRRGPGGVRYMYRGGNMGAARRRQGPGGVENGERGGLAQLLHLLPLILLFCLSFMSFPSSNEPVYSIKRYCVFIQHNYHMYIHTYIYIIFVYFFILSREECYNTTILQEITDNYKSI